MTATPTRFLTAAAIASTITLTGLTPSAVLAGTMPADEYDIIHRRMAQTTPEARSVGSIVGGYGAGKGSSGIVRGAGVLVGGRYVLTAAHIVDDMNNSGEFRLNGQTYQINRFVVARRFYSLETTTPTLNPESRNYGNGTDLALIELNRRVKGARRLKATLNKSRKEAGKTATIVGFGSRGNGATGISTLPITDTDGGLNNGQGEVWNFEPVKRAGKNIVEPTGPFAGDSSNRELVVDFDPDPSRLSALTDAGLNPPQLDPFTGEYNLDEDDIPISGEFIPAVGDSGGGLFINGRLAGITSWSTRANSEFFSQVHFTRISLGWHKWVKTNIAAFNRLRADPSLMPWVKADNGGAGFRGVLKIRDEGNLLTVDDTEDTLRVLKIFGPNLFVNPDLDVGQNLGPDSFIFNDAFGSDPAPLPEPTSLALLGLGGLAVLRRSRR